MPLISSILIGVTRGSCSTEGYARSLTKLPTMDSSDLLKIQKLRTIARSTPVSSITTSTLNTAGYTQLLEVQFANRVSVPLCTGQF